MQRPKASASLSAGLAPASSAPLSDKLPHTLSLSQPVTSRTPDFRSDRTGRSRFPSLASSGSGPWPVGGTARRLSACAHAGRSWLAGQAAAQTQRTAAHHCPARGPGIARDPLCQSCTLACRHCERTRIIHTRLSQRRISWCLPSASSFTPLRWHKYAWKAARKTSTCAPCLSAGCCAGKQLDHSHQAGLPLLPCLRLRAWRVLHAGRKGEDLHEAREREDARGNKMAQDRAGLCRTIGLLRSLKL